MQLVPSIGAPRRGDHVGTLTVAVDLTGGEKSPVKARSSLLCEGDDADRWGHPVSDRYFKMDFSILHN